MVLLTICSACRGGKHDEHRRVIQAAPKGMIGGSACRKLDQILDESSFGPKSRPDPRKEEDTMDGDRISAHYDVEADALHIALTQVSRVDSTIEAAPCVMLDKKGGEVVGIEVLYPRQPLQLAKVAAEHGFAEHLDAIYGVAASVLGVSCSGDVKLTTVEAWAAR